MSSRADKRKEREEMGEGRFEIGQLESKGTRVACCVAVEDSIIEEEEHY